MGKNIRAQEDEKSEYVQSVIKWVGKRKFGLLLYDWPAD